MTWLSCFGVGSASYATAYACGGLFCGAIPVSPAPPEPVDQTAERIVFELFPNEVAAHVQITYVGPADEFAWVVPVPAVPLVEESNVALFDQLEEATRMPVTLPPAEPCPAPNFDSGGLGIACAAAADSLSGAEAGFGSTPDAESPVIRHDSGMTANFTFDVISAENSRDLVTWLQNNGYNVSDNMTPVMDVYLGLKFVALKLRDGRSASDITPIKVTYEADHASIPIRMTAVAAQPFMGIQVYVVADTFALPGNYDLIKPVVSELSFDQNGRTNYFDWVARKADEASGQLFVLEALTDFPNSDGRKVSRFYTRMSPENMKVDPTFARSPGLRPYRAALDFSSRPSLWGCVGSFFERLPAACAFNYCGVNSTCSDQAGVAACECEADKVAQSITGPDGSARIACVPATNPVGITAEASRVGTEFDPCRNVDCGRGSCATKSGFVTCACEEGQVALLANPQSGQAPQCRPSLPGAPTFGPGAGVESLPTLTVRTPSVRRGLVYAGGIWALLGIVLATRLRRRR